MYREALHNQQKQDQDLTVAQIMNSLLQNFRTLAKNIQISREKVGHKG